MKKINYFNQPISTITKMQIGIKNFLFKKRTKYQNVIIADLYEYGLSLILDDLIQITEIDEFYYHELLVHPAMISHKNPKKILIIGGGDGCALREVLKYNIEKATLVDIDGELVDLCKKYFKKINKGSLENKKSEILIMDGKKFVNKCREKYDCIILDLTDPFGPEISKELYSYAFYKNISNILNKDGIVVTQAGSAFYFSKVYKNVYNNVSKVFKIVKEYNSWVPSFGYNCCYIIASNEQDPSLIDLKEIEKRIRERKIFTKFYNSKVHVSLFLFPIIK